MSISSNLLVFVCIRQNKNKKNKLIIINKKMAAIGKIRSWGPILVSVIALALFAFIAEEAFRSCSGVKGEASQQIGEV